MVLVLWLRTRIPVSSSSKKGKSYETLGARVGVVGDDVEPVEEERLVEEERPERDKERMPVVEERLGEETAELG